MAIRDLTGQKFGKLLALYPTDRRADGGSVVWNCICECGQEKEVSSRRLVKGKVKSCGCLAGSPCRDLTGQKFGKLTVTGYAGKGNELGYRSRERYWHCICECGNTSLTGQTELLNGDTKSCGCLRSVRMRKNLKLVDGTSVVLLERGSKLREDNRSGKTGVSYLEKEKKWTAYINFKKKRYWLGRFDEWEEAVNARKAAEEMHEAFLTEYYADKEVRM